MAYSHRFLRAVIGALVTGCLLLTGCSSDNPVTAPTATPPTTPAPAAPALPTVTNIDINPSFVGGESASATLTISREAPPAGTEIALTSSDQSIVLPKSVAVAAGSTAVTFPVVSSRVIEIHEITISATAGGETRTVVVRLRPVDTTGRLSFVSRGTLDHVGQGRTMTFVTPGNKFVGELTDGNRQLDIGISVGTGFAWHLALAAPPGQSLTVRRYENATALPYTTAQVNFAGESRACGQNGIGEFEIRELEIGPPGPRPPTLRTISGTIIRLRATFTQQCSPTAPLLTGEVSATGLPRIGTVNAGLLAWLQPPWK